MPNIYRDFGNIFRPIVFDSSSLYWGITHYAWSFVARLSFVHPSLFLRSSFALWTKKPTKTLDFTYPQHRIWGEMTFARCFGGYKITSLLREMLAYAVLMQAGLVENNPLKLSQISNLSYKKGMPQYAFFFLYIIITI